VNTGNLSQLDFSEEDENEGEISWSHDAKSLNMIPFTSRLGEVSRLAHDGTAKDLTTPSE